LAFFLYFFTHVKDKDLLTQRKQLGDKTFTAMLPNISLVEQAEALAGKFFTFIELLFF
jgi:hypothetical protein